MMRIIFTCLVLVLLPKLALAYGPVFGAWCNTTTTVSSSAGFCWGDAAGGALGNGTTTPNRTTPSIVSGGFTDWTKISTGTNQSEPHTCGLRNGLVYCWGYDSYGELGNGAATGTRTTPSLVSGGFTDWTDISTGGSFFASHSCGIRNGLAYCWGDDAYGQLGNGAPTADMTTPSLVSGGFTDWIKISAGGYHSCGIRSGGQAYCWGAGETGRLGDGTTTANRTTPVLVLGGFTDWTDISTGNDHTCGIRGGLAYCWGREGGGQLGNGAPTADRTTPSLVSGGFTDWTDITASLTHSCGIRGGQAYCWGTASGGGLGNGTTTPDRTTPSLVSGGFTDWTNISAGGTVTTCGIRDGRAYCWGSDATSVGKKGDGTTVDRTTPSLVLGGFTNWTDISMGPFFACGVTTSVTITNAC